MISRKFSPQRCQIILYTNIMFMQHSSSREAWEMDGRQSRVFSKGSSLYDRIILNKILYNIHYNTKPRLNHSDQTQYTRVPVAMCPNAYCAHVPKYMTRCKCPTKCPKPKTQKPNNTSSQMANRLKIIARLPFRYAEPRPRPHNSQQKPI